MADKSIYKVEDGKYSIFGNTYGNGQFSLIYSGDETLVRIESTTNFIHPINWELITEIGDGQGGFYTDKADLESRGLPGFVGIPAAGDQKAHIIATSLNTITISSDTSNPSYIEGFNLDEAVGFELENAATGTFKNVTGRTVNSMVGTISLHPTETGGGTGVLQIMSERSSDGIVWTSNDNSLRTIEVAANGESFATKVSMILDVLPDERFRFRLVETGVGGIVVLTTSETILGDVISSVSAAFVLTEQ